MFCLPLCIYCVLVTNWLDSLNGPEQLANIDYTVMNSASDSWKIIPRHSIVDVSWSALPLWHPMFLFRHHYLPVYGGGAHWSVLLYSATLKSRADAAWSREHLKKIQTTSDLNSKLRDDVTCPRCRLGVARLCSVTTQAHILSHRWIADRQSAHEVFTEQKSRRPSEKNMGGRNKAVHASGQIRPCSGPNGP